MLEMPVVWGITLSVCCVSKFVEIHVLNSILDVIASTFKSSGGEISTKGFSRPCHRRHTTGIKHDATIEWYILLHSGIALCDRGN
jgi:hypothetical protein